MSKDVAANGAPARTAGKRSPGGRSPAPWLWLLPTIAFLGIFLVYPVIDTIRVSLLNADSSGFVGAANYGWAFTSAIGQGALLNNLLWLVVFTFVCVALGTLFAILFGRVRYEPAAKAAVFVPMAISFVAAAVIWRFVYAYEPPGFPQIGLANAIGSGLGLPPQAWLISQNIPYTNTHLPAPFYANNVAIIVVGVWMWTGFTMVVLSAALKSIPREIIEAARVDGAGEWQVAWRIILPSLVPTIAVMATTLIITSLKNFDIVWVTTAGNYGTDVVGTALYKQMFNYANFGRAAALAVILFLAIIPVTILNLRRSRGQEAAR